MAILHPIDILKTTRAGIDDERTKIQEEANRIRERLLDISDIIAEYDVAIAREEGGVIAPSPIDSTEPDKLYPFTESKLKLIASAECVNKCGDLNYGRKGDQLTIRTASGKHTLNTSWNSICDYYNSLPDKAAYNQIGLSIEKKGILVSFYARHPNFNCSVVPAGNSKMLIKEPVRVSTNTHPEGKAEADVSAY